MGIVAEADPVNACYSDTLSPLETVQHLYLDTKIVEVDLLFFRNRSFWVDRRLGLTRIGEISLSIELNIVSCVKNPKSNETAPNSFPPYWHAFMLSISYVAIN